MDENNVTPNSEQENDRTDEAKEPFAEPVQPPVNQTTPAGDAAGNGMSIAAMVLGIVALVFFCTAVFAIICSILAIIFAAISLNNKRPGRGMAITGLVTGIVALVPAVIVIIIAGVSLASIASCIQSYI